MEGVHLYFDKSNMYRVFMTVLCSEYTIISAYRKPPQASRGTMLQNTAFAAFHEIKLNSRR